ncbi:hypothetical protein QOT17_002475 [Balamuthia mandrillaris]
MSSNNPFEKIVKRVLILTMVFNVLAVCGLIVFAAMVKLAFPIYGSMLAVCLIGSLLQAFYFYAASSNSLPQQTWALGLMITTMVLSVFGAILYLLFILFFMTVGDLSDEDDDEYHDQVYHFYQILLSVTMPLWGVAMAVQVVLLVLWVKLRCFTERHGYRDVECAPLQ